MANFKEAYISAKNRVNPEGLAISTLIAGSSPFVLVPTQAMVTLGIHELSKSVDPTTMGLVAIGTIALFNTASIIVESRALLKEQFCDSPVTNIINVISGKPTLSSFLGHLGHFGENGIVSLLTLINNDQGKLFSETALATNLVLGCWNLFFNSMILSGNIDPVVKGLKKARKKVKHVFTRKNLDDNP